MIFSRRMFKPLALVQIRTTLNGSLISSLVLDDDTDSIGFTSDENGIFCYSGEKTFIWDIQSGTRTEADSNDMTEEAGQLR
jgi:hypothetical protein